ncbi:MAG: M4 family metallopeptidase [Sphingobacteriales bacterium]|nr:M4 family metallopeptidase [Sphingobacteriales bacterium]
MKNQFHTRLLLLFLSTTLVIAGCIAFGAKKTLLVAQQTKTKAIEQPITVENQPKTLCPKLKSGSHNYTTFNFLYVLDTTDKNCIATKWQDLFGEEKLFPIQKDVNLVFEGKQPGGSIYSACRFQEDHNYVQYYKGIKVEGSRIMLTYDKGKIVRLVGTYYPHLNIDTTGMLSKEEAAMLVLKERNTPAEAYTRTIQYMLNYSDLKVDPIRQRITYSFWFILGEKSGTYVVNALTGLVESHTPYKFAHVCYKCAADSINAIANTTTCSTLCTTKLDSTFIDHRMVVVPTLYNDCQAIYADSCKVGDTIVYRLSPLLLDSLGSISYKINDTINIVDASVLDAGGAPLFQEVKYCYNDSILSGKSAAANSIFYGMKLAKEYFQSKNIDDNKRLHVWAHLPFPLNNYAGYSLISKIFIFGDGDSITFNPFVSADIIAHEYGHSVLHRKFNIGSHVTDTLHINRYEAGALHEGIADIFSVLVRKHAYGTINWVIGDDVVIPTSTTLLPRDLAHPQNTTPPQALYYNDPAANWDTTQTEIYNHAGIIAKWFYLLSNGGMGYYYATDSITVEPLTIDTAEMVLIKGLDTLSRDSIKIPSFEKFAVAMAAAAQTISCTAHKQTIRALKAVGLGLNIPGGKTTLLTEDESLCFIDLRMRDCYNDQALNPIPNATIGWVGTIFGTAPIFGFAPKRQLLFGRQRPTRTCL